MANNPTRVGVALSVLLAAAVVGRGEGTSAAAPAQESTDAAPKPAKLLIKDFTYSPEPLRVRRGQKIKVTNTDRAAHTITANDMSFDSRNLSKGQSFVFSIAKKGSYDYLCDLHQYMTGKIIVS